MKDSDGPEGVGEVFRAPPMVTQHAPVFEPGERVLDASAAFAMSPPSRISHDATAAKHGGAEIANSSIAAIGEHAFVLPTPYFDRRASVCTGSFRLPGPPADVANLEAATDEDLRVA